MRATHYGLALLPIGAVWLYVLGQSGQQLVELIDGIASAAAPESSQEERAPLHVSAAESTIVAEQPEAPTERARETARDEPPASSRYEPAPLPEPYAAEPAAPDSAEHRPEITNPAIRRRLQAAWDD